LKLLFDLQGLQNGSRNRGIGRYVRSLFDAMARREDIRLYALLNGGMEETLTAAVEYATSRIGAGRVLVMPGLADTRQKHPDNQGRRKITEAMYEAFVDQTGCDVLLVGTAVEGYDDDTCFSLMAPAPKYLKSAIVYDLIPLLDPASYLGGSKLENWYDDRIRQLNAADLLLAISESSRREAIDHLKKHPSQVIAISTAMDDRLFRQDVTVDRSILNRLGLIKPFLMHCGVIEPRKNFDGLVKAFAALPVHIRGKHQLLLAGKIAPEMEALLRESASAAGIPTSDLIIPGFVSDHDLAVLYRACRLFVFPSFHEGFGLPALEAMASGCPTIGSNVTGIPEVIGNPAYTFHPADTAAMSAMMQELLTNDQSWADAKAHALRHAASFSWSGVAERLVVALRNALAMHASSPQPAYPSARRMAEYVAQRVDLAACPRDDVIALARSLAAAEDELVAKCAASLPKKGRIWRIEGPFDSSYSLSLVNRETARAMAELGWEVALHSTEGAGDFPANPDFLASHPDLAVMHDRASEHRHQSSFAASRLLYPPRVTDMTAPINAVHSYAWEETGFPHEWASHFNSSLTMMTTLSTHVEKLMIDNGVSVPMVTSGCGVDHWERIVPDDSFRIDARDFRFLHVSSCFPRKGVNALLDAYEQAFTIDDDVSLVIKTFENPHNDVREKLEIRKRKNPRFPHVVLLFTDLAESQLKSLYGQCQVMVGPSYAEGYGLPFAEAMLSGIPVITTNWGGQLDFCNSGNSWLVDYQFERAQTHFRLWVSCWAHADVESLTQAMRDAYAATPQTRAAMAACGREQLMARHQWRHVAQRLTAAAAILPARRPREPRIGWISTWHSKCGVAAYSQYVVNAMPQCVTVFSPENEEMLIGPDQSIRSWRKSKLNSRLSRILDSRAAGDLDTFIIQFNFGFYNHGDLSEFIRRAKDRGHVIVICLHSTVFPLKAPDPENYEIDFLVPALALCDRVLVHSVHDLNRLKRLGLVDNVALFSHGVLLRDSAPPPMLPPASEPVISTYGFALPHKGLPEMLSALRILHDRGRKVRLRMVNARYPVPESDELIEKMKRQAQELGLEDHVELHHLFLPDEDSLALLTDSDLVVFPYQNTEESSSAAVRYGLAVQRPVAVTPLPIFSDLEGVTFRFAGIRPIDLADGIAAALDSIKAASPEAVEIAEQAARWRDQHGFDVVGRRLFNMCKALLNR
jgi:glycosyltransferase involved in cell wall biosynthesis